MIHLLRLLGNTAGTSICHVLTMHGTNCLAAGDLDHGRDSMTYLCKTKASMKADVYFSQPELRLTWSGAKRPGRSYVRDMQPNRHDKYVQHEDVTDMQAKQQTCPDMT